MIFCKKKSCDSNHSCLFTMNLCYGKSKNTEHKHMHRLKLFREWFISFIRWVWIWETTSVVPCYKYCQLSCIKAQPYTFIAPAISAHTSIPKQPPPSPLPLFTPSSSTATLYHNLPKCQITRLQRIQNSLARAVVKAPIFSHSTPILRSLHWLKITERIVR